MTVSTPAPPRMGRTPSGWEETAQRIARDVQRLPIIYRFLLVHMILGAMETDHRQLFMNLAEFSGIAIPLPTDGALPPPPAPEDDANPLFAATAAASAVGAHSAPPSGGGVPSHF